MARGEERTSSAALLLPVGLCCLAGLIGLAMAVGAVVPPVGDAMSVDDRGVGGMVGYLIGAVFFGGLGLGGLWLWRRAEKDRATPRVRADLAVTDDFAPLPEGPGVVARWCVAAPLLLLATLVPTLGHMAVSAWASLSFNGILPDFGEPDPTFWSEFRENLGYIGYAAILPGLVLLVFLVRRTMFAMWPKTCLWLAVYALAPGTLFSSINGSFLPNLAFGAGLVWLNYLMGRLALWRLSQPIALDLVPSELEVPYQVPDSYARLRVQRDRLTLDRLRSGKAKVRKEILWAELSEARLEHVDTARTWQASAGTHVDVPPGPALRLRGAEENWLLPIEEALGEDLTTLITLRAKARQQIE